MSGKDNEFRDVKVSLAEVQIEMVNELLVARGIPTRSALIRHLILDAYASSRRAVPPTTHRETVSVPVKTQSGEFLAMVDTGSDHTLVPESYAKDFVFTKSRPIWTFGAMTSTRLYEGEVEVMEKKILVEHAILTVGEVGILGMDVLKHFEVFIREGKVTVKPI